MNQWIKIDERSEAVSGKIAFLFLGITQAGLLIGIILQRYLLDRPPLYYNDLAILLGLSVVGFWISNLLFGGVIPPLTPRSVAGAYLLLVFMIAVPYLLLRGLPDGSAWQRWLLVILGGPALLIAVYAGSSFLGRKRLDRLSSK